MQQFATSFFSIRLCFIFVLFGLASTAEERPNILLVLSDDHSVPHVGAYGDENCKRLGLTPNLDAFAKESMRFTRAYVAAPQCAPSRISIFSGQSPAALGVTRFGQPARSHVAYFTDVLGRAGYWTGLDGRHQHLDGRMKDLPHVIAELEDTDRRGKNFESRFDHFVQGASTKAKHLPQVGAKFGAALDKVPEGQPFFLYFGFNQPHRKFGDDHEGIDPATLKLPPDWPDLPEVRLDFACFLAEVRDLDTGYGVIMRELEKRGLKDNTIVVFMGDNGEALLRGKGTVWERGLRVPLMVRWPEQVRPNTVSDALVSGTDLAPTILEAAGAQPHRDMSGTSFLSVLKGQKADHRDYAFAERGWHHGPVTRTDGFDVSRAVISKTHHYIYNVLPERLYVPVGMADLSLWDAMKRAAVKSRLSDVHQRMYFPESRPVFELYDLQRDPYQLNNLAGNPEFKGVETELRHQLDRWVIREGDYVPLPSHALDIAAKQQRTQRAAK